MIMKEKKKYFASQVCRSLMKRIEMKSHFQGKLPITAVAPKVASEEKLIWIIIINVLIWIKSTTAHFYIQLWNSSPKQPSLIILSQPTYTRASLAQNRWFCGNKGFRFVHLTINSGRPQQHSKKVSVTKYGGGHLSTRAFCLTLEDFCFTVFSAWDLLRCQEGLSGNDYMCQKWQYQEQEQSNSPIIAQQFAQNPCCLHFLSCNPTVSSLILTCDTR